MQLGPIRENSRAATGQSLHSIGAMPAPTMGKNRALPAHAPATQPACYTAAVDQRKDPAMLPPKAILDTLASHASRLFSGDNPLPRSEIEAQLKALLQSAFGKLDLVSREEFDSQMAVLARTRARLEALEAKLAELEARQNPPAE